VKTYPVLNKPHAMKTYGGEELQHRASLTSALGGNR